MSITDQAQAEFSALDAANRELSRSYPGERSARQPVHTVYGGAHLYRAETTQRLGELALASFDQYARDPIEFATSVGFVPRSSLQGWSSAELATEIARDGEGLRQRDFGAWLAATIYARVRSKLAREAVEDFRIDFEDGFGARSDAEEDAAATRAGLELARALKRHLLPPFIGIRIKSFGEECRLRSARTLEIFLAALLGESGGQLPSQFVVTLPKVTLAEQPRALVRSFELLESHHRLEPGALRLELMIESTLALLGPDGSSPLPKLLSACEGRCRGAHFGTYDFTASAGITAACQHMRHPLCDLAKGLMLLAYAGTGIFLSDGATTVIPVGPHRAKALTPEQFEENRRVVHGAWQQSYRDIRHSLENGYHQGWDLHPAQIPVRYAACYAFFLEGLAPAAERLKNFIERAAHATLAGDVFDDAATGQGLLNYFLRAQNSGAITAVEAAATGLSQDELSLRSFAQILEARRMRMSSLAPRRSMD